MANNNITLVIINQKAPYVYKPWPIASTCKKFINEVSANIGLKALYTIFVEENLELINNSFKLVNRFNNADIAETLLKLNGIIVKNS